MRPCCFATDFAVNRRCPNNSLKVKGRRLIIIIVCQCFFTHLSPELLQSLLFSAWESRESVEELLEQHLWKPRTCHLCGEIGQEYFRLESCQILFLHLLYHSSISTQSWNLSWIRNYPSISIWQFYEQFTLDDTEASVLTPPSTNIPLFPIFFLQQFLFWSAFSW